MIAEFTPGRRLSILDMVAIEHPSLKCYAFEWIYLRQERSRSQLPHVEPDMVVLAKALSGGLIPVGAILMSDAIYKSVFGSLRNAVIHASTFSENSISMRAGLATLQVLDHYRLGERGAQIGERLRLRLRSALSDYEMVKEIRRAGLLSGIVFSPPQCLRLRVAFEAFRKIHGGMFGQVIVMRLFRDHGLLTQYVGTISRS